MTAPDEPMSCIHPSLTTHRLCLLITSNQTIMSTECHEALMKEVHDARDFATTTVLNRWETATSWCFSSVKRNIKAVVLMGTAEEEVACRSSTGRWSSKGWYGNQARFQPSLGEDTTKQPTIDEEGFTVPQPRRSDWLPFVWTWAGGGLRWLWYGTVAEGFLMYSTNVWCG